MRSLTDAEARVIGNLLAAQPGPERDRLRELGLPRSTYHAARRRAYAEGWVTDRYVPEPATFGFTHVVFVLARPFADKAVGLTEAWARFPGNVVVWRSTQFALGVFFLEGADPPALALLVPGSEVAWSFSVVTASEVASIAAYFDFEGLWTHLGELSGAQGYPHGLGGSSIGGSGEDHGADGVKRRGVWAVDELIHRPFVAAAQGRAGHLVGPFGLPWSQQKVLRSGAIRHRTFLDPTKVPPFRGRVADQVTFVVGELNEKARPQELFAALTHECRTYPFLFVAGGARVLVGALGRGSRTDGEPLPRESKRSVMATLQAAMHGIEIVQDQVTRVQVLADHRYDRLFPAPRAR